MPYFADPYAYVQSCATITAKIQACDAIIDALLISATKAAAGENITQYSLNDGQTVISATPRSSASIMQSITAFELLRNTYAARINGRIVRLVDSKNLTGNGY